MKIAQLLALGALLAATLITLPLSAQEPVEDDPAVADKEESPTAEAPADMPLEETDAETSSVDLPPASSSKWLDKPETPVEEEQEDDSAESKTGGFRFSDFVKTKINFTYADDNLLENSEFSPKMGIGQRNVSEFTGGVGELSPIDVQQTHLTLHHQGEGYLPGLLTEAALVLRFGLSTDPTTGSPNASFADDGSFLRAGYVFDHASEKSMALDLTGFPFDSDRFLLGYHYDLSWAGETSFPQNNSSVPGLRLGFTHPWFYVFAGFKTHLQPKKDKLATERVPVETVYAGLFGFGLSPVPVPGLLIETNGGLIEKGDNPGMIEVVSQEGRDDIMAWGVSSRVSYSYGLPISNRMDLRMQENDPRTRLDKTGSDTYEPNAISFVVSGEFDYLSQNLQDPDVSYGTKAFNAPAALVAAKFKWDYLRVYLEGAYRSLEFLIFDTPGFVPFQALPDSAIKRDELYAVLAVDYHIKQAYLTLGVTGGYKRPATYQGARGVPIAVVKRRTTSSAYISPFNRPIEILPEGEPALDIIEAKFNAQFDMSDFMSLMLELSYTLDNNRTKLDTGNNSETLVKVFDDSNVTNRLGLALVLQAAF